MTDGPADAVDEDAFREDLRRLGDLHRTRLKERPSQRTLAASIGGSHSNPGAWLSGKTIPQTEDRLVKLIRLLREEAERAHVDPDLLSDDLLNPERWRAQYRSVKQGLSGRISAGVREAQAAKELDSIAARERFAALPDKPHPTAQWTAQQLGVHPAIGAATGEDHTFVVPQYVERGHDRAFRDLLTAAADGDRNVMVVLRGGSCTGKTRTAFEGVKACLPDWQLVFPKDADSLALLSADVLPPRTVVWLNEAQEHLAGPSGESAAAALRRLLETTGPVVVVATLWPAKHHELTRYGGTHDQARAVLQSAKLVKVPHTFSAADLQTLEKLRDPSLKRAIEAGGSGAVTQTLAAGPQLVDHYRRASGPHGPYGRAVIIAAMDARRLGHTSPISAAFLKAAVHGYLTEQQRADADAETWFDGALEYAREKVMGVARALEPVADPDGMGSLPGVYRLSDFLDHYARTVRLYEFPPDSFWAAVRQSAATPTEMTALGTAAERRGRYRIAASVYRQAADAGESRALLRLAQMHRGTDSLPQVEALFREAATRGESWAWRELVHLAEAAGDGPRADAVLREAVEVAGDHQCRWLLVEQLGRRGRYDEAAAFARGADADTRERLLIHLAERRAYDGDTADAVALFREAGGGGLHRMAMMARHAGDLDATQSLLHQAAEAGWPVAIYDLAELRQEAGDREGAARLLRQAAAAGVTTALWDLALEAEEAGKYAEAERLAELAADDSDPEALKDLAFRRDAEGRREDAERLARQADAIGGEALEELARRREKEGDRAEAERLARASAELGNPTALRDLVLHREESGDHASADTLAREALIAGDPDSLRYLIRRHLSDNDPAGARRVVMDIINCGHSWALGELAILQAEIDCDIEGARRIEQFGLEGNGEISPEWP